MTDLAAEIQAEAAEAHKRYSQYDRAWEGWHLVVVKKRVRTKLGVAFEAGEIALCSPTTRLEKVPPRGANAPYEAWPEREFATVYSRRNKINTAIPVRDVFPYEEV